jgi:hypothetical protein
MAALRQASNSTPAPSPFSPFSPFSPSSSSSSKGGGGTVADDVFIFACVLGGAYLLLLLLGLVLFSRVHYYTKSCTKQKSVQALIILCAAVRTAFWALALLHWDAWFSSRAHALASVNDLLNGSNLPPLAYVLNNLPGVMYFSMMSLLLDQWAVVYYTAIDESAPYHRCFVPALSATNCGVWLVQITMWVLFSLASTRSVRSVPTIELISTGSLALVYLAMVVAVLVFGRRTRRILQDVPIEFSVISKKVGEVGFLTKICAACFTLRALYIVWGNVEPFLGESFDLPPPVTVSIVATYYALFEIVPCAAVLFYNRRLPPRPPSFPASRFYAEDRVGGRGAGANRGLLLSS